VQPIPWGRSRPKITALVPSASDVDGRNLLPEQHSMGKPASKSKRGTKSIDGLGPASMVSEDALTGEGRSLSAIANVEFDVEVA
jgi:hypothetical protein